MLLYLIVKGKIAAVVCAQSHEDIGPDLFGGEYDLHEIGIANFQVAPGMVMGSWDAEVTTVRPLGLEIKPEPTSPNR